MALANFIARAAVLGSLAIVSTSVGAGATAVSEVETLPVPGDLPVSVIRGAPGTTLKMVFLHGRCARGIGYVKSFESAAMQRGTLVAPDGDVACDAGPSRKWSLDTDKLDARVNAAFRAAGEADPATIRDILVIGYSQGAVLAESLAERWPDRYSRVILIGGPGTPSATRLQAIRGAVTMAGDRDMQEKMRTGARVLAEAHIPSMFFVLPDAAHGEMGSRPEDVMGDALDWLLANENPPH